QWQGAPIINGSMISGTMIKEESIVAPFDRSVTVGKIGFANLDHVSDAITTAQSGLEHWRYAPVARRAECLRNLADKLEENLA
ncbi:aldehyde dehydrogenase family protein, partial [Vibrio sp. 10N.261.45.A4]